MPYNSYISYLCNNNNNYTLEWDVSKDMLDRGINVIVVTISKVIKVVRWHSHPSTSRGDLSQGEIWKFLVIKHY